METDTPAKEQTGGLKLMTVFIVVLALHVLVIGGISVYHLFKGSSKEDASLAQNGSVTNASTVPAKETDSAATTPAANGPNIETTAPAPLVNAPNQTDTSAAMAALPVEGAENATPSGGKGPVMNPHHAAVPADQANHVANGSPAAPVETIEPATAATVTAASMTTYVVKSGDSLVKIAKAHGITVAELKKDNSLKSTTIRIGQKLQIANRNGAAPAFKLAGKTGTTPVAANASTPDAVPAKAAGKSYKVAPGDTLVKIAKHFKTTPAAIMAVNKITDAKKLKVGATIAIPNAADKKQISEQQSAPALHQTASAMQDLVSNH